jgi:hypothetical protein
MKRQAILIGARGKENTKKYLHGVEYDIKKYISCTFAFAPTHKSRPFGKSKGAIFCHRTDKNSKFVELNFVNENKN